MNLQRCENGHFYDAERFDSCPHCNQSAISTVMGNTQDGKEYTMPLPSDTIIQAEVPPTPAPEPQVQVTATGTEYQQTVGYFGDVSNDPVVGWLVSIEGSDFGQDFRLKTGRNFIGRSSEMDVSLSHDKSISRERHAIILYEPRSNVFIVQPGDAKELFYLNDKVVLTATEINAYDVLSLGNTKLLFIPCCSEKFTWESIKSDETK